MFEVGIGTSQNWDPEKAAEEIITQATEKISAPPTFMLLFSTIHYKKNNSFQIILDRLYKKIPKETPLIGGTIAGFMNSSGVFTRGITLLICSSDEIDIATGIGHNTKREPKKAANQCISSIKNKLKKSKYKNKILFIFSSGPSTPRLPVIGSKKVIKSKYLARIMTNLLQFSLIFLQKGAGREEEILEEIISKMPEYTIIGGSTIDDNKVFENYEFFSNKIFENSIVALGISLNYDISISTTYGLEKSGTKFLVTKKAGGGRVIERLNNQPAAKELLEKEHWLESELDERVHRRTLFTPLGYEQNGKLFPIVIGAFWGQSILCARKIDNPELDLLLTSGKKLINSVEDNMSKIKNEQILFTFLVSCIARLETLGTKTYITKEKIENVTKGSPFLLIYAGGEDAYSPTKGGGRFGESFNRISIIKNKN